MNDKQIDNFLRRRFSTVGWALLGYNAILNILVWAVFGLDILGGFVQNLSAGTRSLPDWDAIYGDAWGYLWAIAVGFVILQAWKGRDYWRRELLVKEKPMTAGVFAAVLCLTVGAQLVSGLWVSLVELVMNGFGRSVTGVLDAISGSCDTFSMFLYSAILGPLAEEVLFRGYVLRSLRPYGKKFAVVLSALLFGLFHGNILQAPYAFLMGLVFGYVTVEYSLTWSVALHVFNNLVLADLYTRLTAGLSDAVYYILDGAVFGGCAVASCVILIANRRAIAAYLRSEWMDRRCLKCFFTSAGIVLLLLRLGWDMLALLTY